MTSMPLRRAWALAVVLCVAVPSGACSPSGGGDGECQGSGCPGSVRDWTPPQVTSVVPADGASNVWARDPITITFSEPIDAASVTDETVALVDQFDWPVGHTTQLSNDRKTLTLSLVGPPAVPNVLHASLGRLRDRAGNVLAGWPVQWRWELPAWQDLANPAGWGIHYVSTYSMAMDGDGTPTLLSIFTAFERPAGFARWDGSGWASLPEPATGAAGYQAVFAGGAGGRLVFVADRRGADPRLLFATVWDGSAWSEPAILNVDQSQQASYPVVRMREDGTALVAWFENGVRVKRWDGAGWTQLGEGVGVPATSLVDLSFDADGSPRVTTRDSGGCTAVYSEASGSWTRTCFFWSGLSMRADAAGDVFGLRMDGAVPRALRVDRCLLAARACYPLGGALNTTSDLSPSSPVMRIDPFGNPVVAWVEGRSIRVAQWDGVTWQPLGGDLDGGVDLDAIHALDLVMGSGGAIGVLWTGIVHPEAAQDEIWTMAKRYNR